MADAWDADPVEKKAAPVAPPKPKKLSKEKLLKKQEQMEMEQRRKAASQTPEEAFAEKMRLQAEIEAADQQVGATTRCRPV